jgi:hypothetical protein
MHSTHRCYSTYLEWVIPGTCAPREPDRDQVRRDLLQDHTVAEQQANHSTRQDADETVVTSHASMHDNVHELLHMQQGPPQEAPSGIPYPSMPTAGARNNYSARSTPYAKLSDEQHEELKQHKREEALWAHKYERSQYARKRCPDLMATGPDMRAALPSRGPPARAPACYAYEASAGSTTTYQNRSS